MLTVGSAAFGYGASPSSPTAEPSNAPQRFDLAVQRGFGYTCRNLESMGGRSRYTINRKTVGSVFLFQSPMIPMATSSLLDSSFVAVEPFRHFHSMTFSLSCGPEDARRTPGVVLPSTVLSVLQNWTANRRRLCLSISSVAVPREPTESRPFPGQQVASGKQPASSQSGEHKLFALRGALMSKSSIRIGVSDQQVSEAFLPNC
jgi:hypothetical protein